MTIKIDKQRSADATMEVMRVLRGDTYLSDTVEEMPEKHLRILHEQLAAAIHNAVNNVPALQQAKKQA